MKRNSNIDGFKRRAMSSSQLPHPIPQHEIEPGLLMFNAIIRPETGKNSVKWLRRNLRLPGRITSLPMPHEAKMMIHISETDAAKLVRVYGRNGCTAQALCLNIVDPEDVTKSLGIIRVKTQEVKMNAATMRLQNMDFMYCPMDRIVNVDVPLKLINDELAPGVKKGGWISVLHRTVRYQALGGSIPPFIEVDCRKLELGQSILVRQLPVPKGSRIPQQNYDAPVATCTTDVGKD
ncbi:MAG: hypothetical protein WDW36_000733 [Sanguina aurantia]